MSKATKLRRAQERSQPKARPNSETTATKDFNPRHHTDRSNWTVEDWKHFDASNKRDAELRRGPQPIAEQPEGDCCRCQRHLRIASEGWKWDALRRLADLPGPAYRAAMTDTLCLPPGVEPMICGKCRWDLDPNAMTSAEYLAARDAARKEAIDGLYRRRDEAFNNGDERTVASCEMALDAYGECDG